MIGKALPTDPAIRGGDIILDFEGVEAVSPSFVDETVAVVEEFLQSIESSGSRILFVHPPTRLSAKFQAIARGHDLVIAELDDGAWVMQGAGTKGE
jgi:hypothetical protein